MSLNIANTRTPVVVLSCKLAALAIMRSLGPFGITLYGIDSDRWAPAMLSGYCRQRFMIDLDEPRPNKLLDDLLKVGRQIGQPSILIPTSDETALFVAKNRDQLSKYYISPRSSASTIEQLVSKKQMYKLALEHHIPTPYTIFPNKLDDVMEYVEGGKFPVVLKGIYGHRLQVRNGREILIAYSKDELIENYKQMENPALPNLMLQEYIPGGDDQVYIFNGYFNERSECLAGFTGFKIRQYPVHVGCASLGECRWNEAVAGMTIKFMQAINYSGILDIGYRFDPRDGQYKVLDINPRVGQAFRLFVAENDMDVVKSLYLNLTGQKQHPIFSREGRRWVIEDFDLMSSLDYYREGKLRFADWLRSFKGLEESAWFSWRDPLPFIMMTMRMLKKALAWLLKKSPTNGLLIPKKPRLSY